MSESFVSPTHCEPRRRCVACRELYPRSQLWRIVRLAHSRRISLDQGMGRSAYLCPQVACLSLAKKRQAIQRALRVRVDGSVYDLLANRLVSKNLQQQ
ncbi:MAG: YlxR family protein [Cyanobacteria bacterium P01_H01_bin.15]